jgi:5'-nucleotidase
MSAHVPILTNTAQGRPFDLAQPTSEQITAYDLAWQLAGIVRWSGRAIRDISVAQHSCLVADWMPEDDQRIHGLLHDAAEAWCGDITTPVKRLMKRHGFDFAAAIEAPILAAVYLRFALDWPDPDTAAGVHRIDQRLLATERRDLLAEQLFDWPTAEPLPVRITPWTKERAATEFLDRLHEFLPEYAKGLAR